LVLAALAVAAALALVPYAMPAQSGNPPSPIEAPKPHPDAPAPPETAVPAQSVAPARSPAAPPVKERFLVGKFPAKPSLPPAWSIPVAPLGFKAPGAIYLGSRNALATLDFLDENHLLFTFRVPGLLHRDTTNGQDSDERQIRAVVLTLPQGTVEAETLWTVHDRVRYLWMLKNGHFLLRDRNKLLVGDPALVLKPFLDFPGPLLRLELDPAQKFMVTNSREPVAEPQKPGLGPSPGSPATGPGHWSGGPSTAQTSVTSDEDSDTAEGDHPEMVVRILRRESGEVMLVSRVRSIIHLPINSTGYIENLRGRGTQWVLNLGYFTGGSRMLGSVDSACEPDDNFVSEQEILVTGCGPGGESKLIAMSTEGRTLWVSQAPSTEIWPQLTVAPNGSRLAWATLDVNHAVNSYASIGAEDVKEQSVTVFDAASGDIALVTPLAPILDAGGNVAISPSGRRVAVINAGAIQVFELPPPPPLPFSTNPHPGK
jgi:hypothetical protein